MDFVSLKSSGFGGRVLCLDELSVHHQAVSEDEEEMRDPSRASPEQTCEQAREQLTNSIRLQWRKLKSHMERLDSQGTTCGCFLLKRFFRSINVSGVNGQNKPVQPQ